MVPFAGCARRRRALRAPKHPADCRVAEIEAPTPAKSAARTKPFQGIVPSLARPGGNITGVSLMASALHGKSVELFRDMLPSVRRVVVSGHSTNPAFAKAMLDEVLLEKSKSRQIRIGISGVHRGPGPRCTGNRFLEYQPSGRKVRQSHQESSGIFGKEREFHGRRRSCPAVGQMN
jgi:hypothetical protein